MFCSHKFKVKSRKQFFYVEVFCPYVVQRRHLLCYRSAPTGYRSYRQGTPDYGNETYSPYMQERAQEWDMKIHDPGMIDYTGTRSLALC